MVNPMGTPACTFKQLWDNVPSLLPGQAAEMSQELLQHLYQEVCDASKVLGNVQEDRDRQQHHLQELEDAWPLENNKPAQKRPAKSEGGGNHTDKIVILSGDNIHRSKVRYGETTGSTVWSSQMGIPDETKGLEIEARAKEIGVVVNVPASCLHEYSLSYESPEEQVA